MYWGVLQEVYYHNPHHKCCQSSPFFLFFFIYFYIYFSTTNQFPYTLLIEMYHYAETCIFIGITGKKESCLQDSPPAAGRICDIVQLRRSAIPAEHFFM